MMVNPAYDRAAVTAPSDAARSFHAALPGYAPTPLRELAPGVLVKDETLRLGLPAAGVEAGECGAAVLAALHAVPDPGRAVLVVTEGRTGG